MSLIADALQKADAPTPIPGPSSHKPRWVTVALVIGCGIVVWNLTREFKGPESSSYRKRLETYSSVTLKEKPAQASIPAVKLNASFPGVTKSAPPVGLNLLRAAEGQWRLSGVIQGDGRPLALINGSVVEEGGSVDGAKVVRITETEVDLEADGKVRTIQLK